MVVFRRPDNGGIEDDFFHHEVTFKPVWFAPLNEPMRLLVFSMLFGLIHMFLGMGLKGYMLLRDRKYLDLFL